MTEQTGNNKPNEAEGLAFPLSGNEKLIEEARRLPDQYRVVQLSETQYLEDQALAELDAVGYQAVHTASRLADALEAAEKAFTPTDSKPVAYGVYGRATGNLKYVQVMDAREVEEQSEFYDVVPLFAIPAARGQTVGGYRAALRAAGVGGVR